LLVEIVCLVFLDAKTIGESLNNKNMVLELLDVARSIVLQMQQGIMWLPALIKEFSIRYPGRLMSKDALGVTTFENMQNLPVR